MSNYEHAAPDRIKTIGLLQIVSGAINVSAMAIASYICIGTFFAACSAPAGSPCAIFGLIGCLLYPFGLLEMAVGVLFFANPRKYAEASRLLAMAEIGSVLLGGIPAAMIGGVVLSTFSDPRVEDWLLAESDPSDPSDLLQPDAQARIAADEEVDGLDANRSLSDRVRAVASEEDVDG